MYITYEGGEETKITFLEDNLFRFNMDPDGDFSDTPEPRSNSLFVKLSNNTFKKIVFFFIHFFTINNKTP